MTAIHLIRALLVLAIALAPIGLHWAVLAPQLARGGHHLQVLLSLIGAVGWYLAWLHALPITPRAEP